MLPTACVDLPAFPLQLLLEDHPGWGQGPAAVVQDDKPQAKLLRVNEAAMRLGILPGMRYAAALSLCGSLNAGVVPLERVAKGVEAIVQVLQTLSPAVEPDRMVPGMFFVDARGLDRLFDGPADLGRRLEQAVRDAGFEARVVIGWTRFGTQAVARGHGRARVVILPTPDVEYASARRVPLTRLAIEPKLRESLRQLGIGTLGAFVDLPPDGLRARFGDAAWQLHAQARGFVPEAFEAVPLSEPLEKTVDLDWPETDAGRLLEIVRTLLEPLLVRVRKEDVLVRELRLALVHDDGERKELALRPAEPTSSTEGLLELSRLRLDRVFKERAGAGTTRRARTPMGVVELTLALEAVRAVAGQGALFVERPRRDPQALGRAIARLHAELGDGAVVRAELRDAHLPEASFAWRPFHTPRAADVTEMASRLLVRTILTRPRSAIGRPRHGHDDGWLMLGDTTGSVIDLKGPFLISGGWWRREVVRAYHWVTTQDGRLLWTYHDHQRRRWFVQGELR